jgi:hypothetical protein
MLAGIFVKVTQSKRINMTIAKQSPLFDSPRALLQVSKHLDILPQYKRLPTISTRNFVAQDELDKARKAFRDYQSTRRRDAIYDYLSAVFEVVRRWKRQDRVKTEMRQALGQMGRQDAVRIREPFAVAIFCSSDPGKVDVKTRSKWSRALRFTEQFKPEAESLAKFIQGRGGINELLR